jgi:hypothetical protein
MSGWLGRKSANILSRFFTTRYTTYGYGKMRYYLRIIIINKALAKQY